MQKEEQVTIIALPFRPRSSSQEEELPRAIKSNLLRPKCSKSRDLIAVAICDSNCELQIISDLRQWGEEPSHLRVVPPGQRSNAVECLERVCVMLSVHVLACCLIYSHLVSALLSAVLSGNQRTAKSWDKTFGVLVLCQVFCPLLRHRGRFPWWGGTCTPRYCGPLGRLPKSAGRPMGPSTLQ